MPVRLTSISNVSIGPKYGTTNPISSTTFVPNTTTPEPPISFIISSFNVRLTPIKLVYALRIIVSL